MGLRTVVLAPIGIALTLLSGTGATGAPSTGPWASRHRPLRLEPLAAGARCPVSRPHPLDHGRLGGAGPGPIHPMPSPFTASDRHPGWLASKTIWAWPVRLKTHRERVLVRGRRLDRRGPVRFQLGPAWDTTTRTTELHIDTTRTVGSFSNSRWGTTVTLLLVRAPGCYGLQLDFARHTETIVIRATPR
ncbi:MAG: hypothetical protein OEW31_00670 [Thermoleophilia bacterium]|nr:hypothetical protein [Thermoleophilia bacterium]